MRRLCILSEHLYHETTTVQRDNSISIGPRLKMLTYQIIPLSHATEKWLDFICRIFPDHVVSIIKHKNFKENFVKTERKCFRTYLRQCCPPGAVNADLALLAFQCLQPELSLLRKLHCYPSQKTVIVEEVDSYVFVISGNQSSDEVVVEAWLDADADAASPPDSEDEAATAAILSLEGELLQLSHYEVASCQRRQQCVHVSLLGMESCAEQQHDDEASDPDRCSGHSYFRTTNLHTIGLKALLGTHCRWVVATLLSFREHLYRRPHLSTIQHVNLEFATNECNGTNNAGCALTLSVGLRRYEGGISNAQRTSSGSNAQPNLKGIYMRSKVRDGYLTIWRNGRVRGVFDDRTIVDMFPHEKVRQGRPLLCRFVSLCNVIIIIITVSGIHSAST